MKQDLQDRITQWKLPKPGLKVLRAVNAENSKSMEGEYEISLKISVRVTDGSQSENVSVSGKMKTTCQSKDIESTSAEDILLFEQSVRQLEADFQSRTSATYKRLAGSQASERNPY